MNELADNAVAWIHVSASIIADVTAITQVKMMKLEKSCELGTMTWLLEALGVQVEFELTYVAYKCRRYNVVIFPITESLP